MGTTYQHCTIEGDAGFSKLNSPACRVGSISCISGECWVRLVKTPTVTASGANADLTDPDANGFTDGWAFLSEGSTMTFGTEAVHDTAAAPTVGQIDLYCSGALVTINQH